MIKKFSASPRLRVNPFVFFDSRGDAETRSSILEGAL